VGHVGSRVIKIVYLKSSTGGLAVKLGQKRGRSGQENGQIGQETVHFRPFFCSDIAWLALAASYEGNTG
jgi:hypothetical protein